MVDQGRRQKEKGDTKDFMAQINCLHEVRVGERVDKCQYG